MDTTHQAMEIYMVVKDAELIRRLMSTKNLTARQLSLMMGWRSHSYMNRILSGAVRSVSNDTGVRLAYFLQVPPDVIFVTKASGIAGRFAKASA